MSQMVLPQASPQGPQADNGSKSVSDNREKHGESPFDSVSRAEQQRIDQKLAEKRDRARAQEDARNVDAQGEGEPSTPPVNNEKSGEATESEAERVADQAPSDAVVPLTFSELQALLVPARGNEASAAIANPGAGNGAIPGVQSFAGMIAGLPGNTASKNLSTGQGAGASASQGLALTEALLSSVGGETSRLQETPSLQAGMRFQSAAELANPNAPKLPAEAAALRGYTTSIDVPVNSAEWGDKLVGKLTWLTARNMSVAEIHLTPPDMGPMEVRVQVQQEQAHITVHSANPAVRDQLELHSHRLRDMLSEQGLSLDQFDVSDSSHEQAREDNAGEDSKSGGTALADVGSDEQDLPSESLDLTWKGEVDIFA